MRLDIAVRDRCRQGRQKTNSVEHLRVDVKQALKRISKILTSLLKLLGKTLAREVLHFDEEPFVLRWNSPHIANPNNIGMWVYCQ
ncbi:hypothetical protein D9M68_792240 [compost metagenome]